MTRVMNLILDNGESILVEVRNGIDDSELSPDEAVRRTSAEIERGQKFGEAIDQLEPVATSIFNRLKTAGLEEATLEFGLKFGAKAGVIFVSADSEATFKLSLKWRPPKE